MTPLPDRLRELREAQCMTRAELSAASGVPERAVESIEVGDTVRPAYDTFLALARALQVSPEDLAAPADVPQSPRRRGRPQRNL